MRRSEVLELVDSLVKQGRWGSVALERRSAIEDSWAEALAPFDPDVVRRVVAFAVAGRRMDVLTLGWVVKQSAHISRRRAVEAQTPRIDCDACSALGNNLICQEHRETGLRNIAELRRRFGWPEPDDAEALCSH